MFRLTAGGPCAAFTAGAPATSLANGANVAMRAAVPLTTSISCAAQRWIADLTSAVLTRSAQVLKCFGYSNEQLIFPDQQKQTDRMNNCIPLFLAAGGWWTLGTKTALLVTRRPTGGEKATVDLGSAWFRGIVYLTKHQPWLPPAFRSRCSTLENQTSVRQDWAAKCPT